MTLGKQGNVFVGKQVKMTNGNGQEKSGYALFSNPFHHYILTHLALWEMKLYMQNVLYVKNHVFTYFLLSPCLLMILLVLFFFFKLNDT